MEPFVWSEKYILGVAEMDEQHRRLVGLFNGLQGALTVGKSNLELEQIFDELIDYTSRHFVWEEKLMDEYDYTGFAEHNAEHEALAKQFFDLQKQFKSGSMRISADTVEVLHDWLIHHILDGDKDFAGYVNAKDALAPSKTRHGT